ncbi:MAG: hypothetical protein ABR532_08400, partial [Candidatus Dormibacteria bacterium]
PEGPNREVTPSMSDAICNTLEAASQPAPTHRDRMIALQVYDPAHTCVCGTQVVIAWDWKRQEAVSLVRAEGQRGKFEVTEPIGGEFTCRGKGLATFFGWSGRYVKHVCPGPAPRPEVDPATLPALGFIGGSTPEEARSARVFAHPDEWTRPSCQDLLDAERERRSLPRGRRF